MACMHVRVHKHARTCTRARTHTHTHTQNQTPIQCHPHLVNMKVCEQKFPVIQYMDLWLPSIYRALFSIYRDEWRRTNSGATSGFDGVHKAQTKSENTLCMSQHNTKQRLYSATCVNNALEFCRDLETCCNVSDANRGLRSIQ